MKTCRDCRLRKEREAFGFLRGTSDGRHPACRECRSAYSAARYRASVEPLAAERASARAWRLAISAAKKIEASLARAAAKARRAEETRQRRRAADKDYRQKRRDEKRVARCELPPIPPPPWVKACTKCGIPKPLLDFPKAKDMRDGRNSWCRECAGRLNSQWSKNYRSTNAGREVFRLNKEKARRRKGVPPRLHHAHVQAYYRAMRAPKAKHQAHVLLRTRLLKRAERIAQKSQSPDHRRRVKKRCGSSKQIPKWANMKAIDAIYAEAARIAKETGVEVEVDHIVPLKSKLVCGLHCEANLWVLPKWVNQEKSNKVWPDMPE